MSLDKSIQSGKSHRKPYRGAKAIDATCRNHGSCKYREEILDRLTGYRVVGEKHNSLHDAEIIKEIYEEIGYDI